MAYRYGNRKQIKLFKGGLYSSYKMVYLALYEVTFDDVKAMFLNLSGEGSIDVVTPEKKNKKILCFFRIRLF